MKLMRATPVVGPSVIEKIRSTRFCGRWMICGSTRGGEFAVAAIELDDALDVGLHLGAGEDRARLDLDFLVEVLVETLLLPSNTTWLMIGFSTTLIVSVDCRRS